jgi:hypothetical protein
MKEDFPVLPGRINKQQQSMEAWQANHQGDIVGRFGYKES